MKRVVLLRSNPVNPDPPVEKVADTLIANGYDVTILCWDRNSDEKVIESTLTLQRGSAKWIRFGIPAIFGGGLKKTLKPLMTFQTRLYFWLKKYCNEYDIIHAFDFDTGFVANRIAKKYDKKLVYHILDFYVDSHQLTQGALRNKVKNEEFRVINHADCSIICTEKRMEQIKGSNPKKITVIHNTPKQVDFGKKPIEAELSLDRCKIVYVGILAGSRFIKEMIEFVKDDERFEFHIGGFGNMEEYIFNQAKQCDRIKFYGKLPYEKTLALEKACDIMTAIYDPAVPNHKFAAPNKFYESLMLGKPVVMAKGTGFDEMIEENKIGCLIEYSREGLASGLYALLNQREQWEGIGEKMKALYQNQYSWEEMENRLVALYAGLNHEKNTDRK